MTIYSLMRDVIPDKDCRVLAGQFGKLIYKFRGIINYEDMLDLVQDAMLYQLRNGYVITAKNLNVKVRYLLLDMVKHRKKITFMSLEDVMSVE
jgi:hypothetical protein